MPRKTNGSSLVEQLAAADKHWAVLQLSIQSLGGRLSACNRAKISTSVLLVAIMLGLSGVGLLSVTPNLLTAGVIVVLLAVVLSLAWLLHRIWFSVGALY